jgi:hypothetical protein
VPTLRFDKNTSSPAELAIVGIVQTLQVYQFCIAKTKKYALVRQRIICIALEGSHALADDHRLEKDEIASSENSSRILDVIHFRLEVPNHELGRSFKLVAFDNLVRSVQLP